MSEYEREVRAWDQGYEDAEAGRPSLVDEHPAHYGPDVWAYADDYASGYTAFTEPIRDRTPKQADR